jgi:hypothetical protein
MSRPAFVAVPVVLLAVAAAAQGQEKAGDLLGVPPLEARELARAKFEASQATAKDLGRVRLEAAWEELRERMERYREGKDTLDIGLGAAKRLLDAELAVAATRADRIAAHERYRRHALELEKLSMLKQAVGREAVADVAQARSRRLTAEMPLVRVTLTTAGNLPREEWGWPLQPVEEPWPEFGLVTYLVLGAAGEVLTVPQAKFEVTRAALPDLARALREAALEEYQARYERYRAGKDTLDIVLYAARRLLEADLPVAATKGERVAAYERYWLLTQQLELLSRLKQEVGREAAADVAQARSRRLAAEMDLVRAMAGARHLPREDMAWPLGLPDVEWREVRELARTKFEATQATLPDLARARREAALEEYQAREKRYQAGQDPLDLVLDAAGRLLEADLAIASTKAERIAAHERHGLRLRHLEGLTRRNQEAGREVIADLAQARSVRLAAEMALAEARVAKDQK